MTLESISGEASAKQRRLTPEEANCLVLHLPTILAALASHPGKVSWTMRCEGRWLATGELILKDGEPSAILIEFDPRTPGVDDPDVSMRQSLPIVTGAAGGVRKRWFLCPSLGSRVETLYQPAGKSEFRSQKAWDLAYETTLMSPVERVQRRLVNLAKQLNRTYVGFFDAPPRPKRMTHKVYQRILAEIDAAERELMSLECEPGAQIRPVGNEAPRSRKSTISKFRR